MARTRVIVHAGEALVLRTWPFHEADLLVSLLTRDQGVVKGIARHAMRSRRRFGGALEPGTEVVAHYAERPREDLMRLDSFEIVWSPLRAPVTMDRVAGLQLVVEVLEQVLPEQAPEDNVYRLALTALKAMEEGPAALPVTYFCVWMCRLMGWWPELGHCAVCGLDLRGGAVWWSPTADGVTCVDDQRGRSARLDDAAVRDAHLLLRSSLAALAEQGWPAERTGALRAFAVALLERHLERRLRSAAMLTQVQRVG